MADIIVDGRVRVAFVPTIADISAPTTTELNAGQLLQSLLIPTGLAGFESTVAEVDNTSLASTFDTKLPGRASYSGTSLTLKKQSGATDPVWTLLTTPGTDGFVVIRANGVLETVAWTAAQQVQVYPVRTADFTPQGYGEANSLERYMVPVMITAPPNKKAVVAG
jgi:hypothetical protein